MSSSQTHSKVIEYSFSFNTGQQSYQNTVCVKMLYNYPVTLLTYCGNDHLNHPTTISEGSFVPKCALRHYSGQKKKKIEVLSVSVVFKV